MTSRECFVRQADSRLSSPMDKKQVLSTLIAQLENDLMLTKQAAQATYDAATNEESKPENEYDTRAVEASYLAGAQAQRASEIDRALSVFRQINLRKFKSSDPIASTALVRLRAKTKESLIFLLPVGGGNTVTVGEHKIKVITPLSNLGEALLGLQSGDVADIKVGSETLEYEVIEVI
jgi:transcription elongation GreA/GreB family factor